MNIYGPILTKPKDVKYQGLTALDRAVEETLLDCDYRDLIEFLHTRTPCTGTDTFYTAVQMVAKEFSQAEILKWLGKPKPKRSPVPDRRSSVPQPGDNPLPSPEKPAQGTPVAPLPRPSRPLSNGNAHPQEVINAKTAIIKSVGGTIEFSRSSKGWLVQIPKKEAMVWTSAEFREMTEEQIKALVQPKAKK